MAKKKKKSPPARGYATTSIERKPDPVPVEAVEEPVEEPNAKTSQPPDAWENGVISALQAEDPHRLLKSQVESEFRTSQIKLEKLLSLDSIPSIAISEKIEKKLYAFISGYAQGNAVQWFTM